jgi:hypothetical protein
MILNIVRNVNRSEFAMITDIELVGIFCIAILYAYMFIKKMTPDQGV